MFIYFCTFFLQLDLSEQLHSILIPSPPAAIVQRQPSSDRTWHRHIVFLRSKQLLLEISCLQKFCDFAYIFKYRINMCHYICIYILHFLSESATRQSVVGSSVIEISSHIPPSTLTTNKKSEGYCRPPEKRAPRLLQGNYSR